MKTKFISYMNKGLWTLIILIILMLITEIIDPNIPWSFAWLVLTGPFVISASIVSVGLLIDSRLKELMDHLKN